MRLSAPAKINLGLRVHGRRADGYHEIDTVMVPISLADTVELEPGGGDIRLYCEPPATSSPEQNLAWQAAALLRERAGATPGVRIRLRKRIPAAAGLGGGSSDAAAVLRGLDRLWQLRLPASELSGYAAELGSDVPFFLVGGPARCRGRGERVDPLHLPTAWPVVLANPGFPVSTAWAYSRVDRHISALTPEPGGPTLGQDWVGQGRIPSLPNDLEPAVTQKFPILDAVGETMRKAGASSVSLSGSGGTVFGLCTDAEAAANVAERLRAVYGPKFWIRTAMTLP